MKSQAEEDVNEVGPSVWITAHRWQILSILVPTLLANLPLIVVLYEHWGSPALWSMLLHYPGQFMWLLVPFPIATYFTVSAGAWLAKSYDAGQLRVKPWWAGWIQPNRWHLVSAIVSCAAFAVLVGTATGGTIYSFESATAGTAVTHFDLALEHIARMPTHSDKDQANKKQAIRHIQWRLANEDPPPEPLPEVSKEWLAFYAAIANSAVAAFEGIPAPVRESFGLTSDGTTKEQARPRETRLPTIVVAEAIELAAALYVGVLLFFYTMLLALARLLARTGPSEETRRAAAHVTLAIVVISTWIPARLYSVNEIRLFVPGYSDPGGPYLVLVVLATCAFFVLLGSSKTRKPLEQLKIVLPLVPIVLSGAAVVADPMTVQGLIGSGTSVPKMLLVLVVGAVVVWSIYSVMTSELRDDVANPVRAEPD